MKERGNEMYRLGAVTLYALIFAAACGAAWLGGLSTRSWMPAAAFWTTLLGLGTIAAANGLVLGGD